jgi:hypothetical protein
MTEQITIIKSKTVTVDEINTALRQTLKCGVTLLGEDITNYRIILTKQNASLIKALADHIHTGNSVIFVHDNLLDRRNDLIKLGIPVPDGMNNILSISDTCFGYPWM